MTDAEQGGAAGGRLPLVHGGILLECVGGPLDGELVFLRGGEDVVHLAHFFDDRRTPWLHGARPGAANYLGYYSPRAFTNGAPADWHPLHNETTAPRAQRGEQ